MAYYKVFSSTITCFFGGWLANKYFSDCYINSRADTHICTKDSKYFYNFDFMWWLDYG